MFQDLNPRQPAAPALRAGQKTSALAASPDGQRLAILTSGYNVYYGHDGEPVPELSTEYLFLFDISGHQPRQTQVLPLTNTFQGLAWSPGSDKLFVSAGSDDAVVEFVRSGSRFETGRTFHLGHTACLGIPESLGYWGAAKRKRCGPVVAGLAASPDGTRLLAANIQNDSVSLIDFSRDRVVAEQDLRPGIIDPRHHGEPGGSFPRSVVWVSSDRGYVASERDRELISLRISHEKIQVLHRVPVHGQPVAVIANRSGSRVYVALDTTSQVAIIDTQHDKVVKTRQCHSARERVRNASCAGWCQHQCALLSRRTSVRCWSCAMGTKTQSRSWNGAIVPATRRFHLNASASRPITRAMMTTRAQCLRTPP